MPSHSPAVLQISDLTKRFNDVVAVDGLSFSIARGEIVGILGANGAGKTTTLQMILGLIRPTSGRIEIFGQDHEQHRIEILRRMNFSSVGVNLPMNLTVSENLWIFAKLYGVKDAWRRLDGLLNLMEIHHLRNAMTGSLSSGEISRVNLCKALLNRPSCCCSTNRPPVSTLTSPIKCAKSCVECSRTMVSRSYIPHITCAISKRSAIACFSCELAI